MRSNRRKFGKALIFAVVLLVTLAILTVGCTHRATAPEAEWGTESYGAGDADALLVTVTEEESSSVTRTLPSGPQTAGSSITVSLDVAVGAATYYGIDEVIPAGWIVLWSVTNASGGDYTSEPGHVKWTVISGAEDTTLRYRATVPGNATDGNYTFTGTYVMEGVPETAIGGDSAVTVRLYHPCDKNQDGVISMDELLHGIGDWKAGTLPMSDLLDLLDIITPTPYW